MKITRPDPATLSRQLHHNVKMFAKAKGCRLKDVEKAIGVSGGYFVRGVENSSSPKTDVLCALSAFFDVPIEDLITDAYEKRMKAAQAKAAFTNAVSQAQETFSKEEIVRIIQEEM